MATLTYSLNNSYTNASKVSAGDLNRRADILAYQLPGSLNALGLDAGVLPLMEFENNEPQPALTAVKSWADASAQALKVTATSNFAVAAGAALVRHKNKHLVWTTAQDGLYAAIPSLGAGDIVYVHLKLAAPGDETALGALDSQTGAPPTLVVSEAEQIDNALLLAEWNGTTLIDRRIFIAPAALSIALKGLDTRITALEAASGGGGGGTSVSWLSQLLYNNTHPIQADTYIDTQLEELREKIEELSGGPKKFPDELSLLADLTGALAVGVFEVNPPTILRTQMSALGRGFGKGQNSTPDLSPNTGHENEAVYNATTGLIAP